MTNRNIENLIPRGPYYPPQLNVTMPAPDVEPIDLEDGPAMTLREAFRETYGPFAPWVSHAFIFALGIFIGKLIAIAAAIVAGLGVASWP